MRISDWSSDVCSSDLQKTRRAVNATWRNFKKSPPSYTASRAQAIKEVQEKERPDHQPKLFRKELPWPTVHIGASTCISTKRISATPTPNISSSPPSERTETLRWGQE